MSGEGASEIRVQDRKCEESFVLLEELAPDSEEEVLLAYFFIFFFCLLYLLKNFCRTEKRLLLLQKLFLSTFLVVFVLLKK